MQPEEIRQFIYRRLRSDLEKFQAELDRGAISLPQNATAVFPTILLLTETPETVIYELTGGADRFAGLRCIHQRCASNALYLGQFNEHDPAASGVLTFDFLTDSVIGGLRIYACDDEARVLARFPLLSQILRTPGFLANANRGLYLGQHVHRIDLSDLLIVNQHGAELRLKYISRAGILGISSGEADVVDFIASQHRGCVPPGVTLCNDLRAARLLVAAQFTSLYLSPFVHEPKLGVFLNENPDFVYRALSTDRFMHEQTFRWQGPRAGEPAIRPDLLVRRTDGTYDIYDLKTALLSRKVTRKSRARRMLDKDLEEGFAQLAHYYEYFIMPENAGYLRDVHGVQVVDPRLVLVTFPPKSMPL